MTVVATPSTEMHPDDDGCDPFSVAKLWQPSVFSQADISADACLFTAAAIDGKSSDVRAHFVARHDCHYQLTLQSVAIAKDNPYVSDANAKNALGLPGLDSFEYGPLSDLESVHESLISFETEPGHQAEPEDDDIWSLAFDLAPPDAKAELLTWDGFKHSTKEEWRPQYLSEAGAHAFDAAFELFARSRKPLPAVGSVYRSNVLIKSLFHLGLGRSSVAFSFDARRKDFSPLIQDGRISGCSLSTAQSLFDRFQEYGTYIRHLHEFVDRTLASVAVPSSHVALASAVSTVLTAVETHLNSTLDSARSVLELQQGFARPWQIVGLLIGIVQDSETARSDEKVASILYRRLQQSEQESRWARNVISHILARVSEPWLEFVRERTGLRVKTDIRNGKQVDKFETNDIIPSFISAEDHELIAEIGKGLEIIRAHHPDHPFLSCSVSDFEVPTLEWRFSWEAVEAAAQIIAWYEQRVCQYIGNSRNHGKRLEASISIPSENRIEVKQESGWPMADLHDDIKSSGIQSSITGRPLPDELYELIATHLTASADLESTSSLELPGSLTPNLSFNPLLKAQSRLVNATTLRLLFREHGLRSHLSIQRSYHLLGDGVFVSRMASALFDPELETAERHRGILRTGVGMGLRLGSRDTWPPASSELRLALMGVLTEAYASSHRHLFSNAKRKRSDELPGNLSFGIRTLSDEEAEMCLNADSLHALDFLRLTYTPPAPLDAIITPTALEKYDNIFKFLLRLTRMSFVTAQFFRDRFKPKLLCFRMETQHFVSCVCRYFFETGVAEVWMHFEQYVNDIEGMIRREDEIDGMGTLVSQGIETLRKKHEECLDEIMFVLLLRKRHHQLKALLDDIFEIILAFSKITRGSSWRDSQQEYQEVDGLHAKFRSKVGIFLAVCKGLRGKGGYRRPASATGQRLLSENTTDRLLTTLEMNGYYT